MFLFRKDKKDKHTRLSKKQREELKISDREYEDYKQAFIVFDKDASGFIEAHELEAALKMLGENPTPEMVQAMIKNADTVREDGKVEFLEFCHLMHSMGRTDTEDICRQLFRVIDKDTSGCINREELHQALSNGSYNMSDDDVEAVFQHADKDGNGTISFPEFVALMKAASTTPKKVTNKS
jgi:calmodulin